jgi:hypothetical protein
MKSWLRLLAGVMGGLSLTGSTCTSTFTQAEVDAAELAQEQAATREEKRDAEIGEQGGANAQAIEEQIEDVDGGSGADF